MTKTEAEKIAKFRSLDEFEMKLYDILYNWTLEDKKYPTNADHYRIIMWADEMKQILNKQQ